MQRVEDPPIETIHLYIVREQEKRPPTFLPLFGAFLCLVGIVALTIYSGQHPYYEHERLTLPATFFTRMYSATAPIIPTGIKTYPATNAEGILTLTNGSVVSMMLPQGLIFSGSGSEVVTTTSAFVPAGSAEDFGIATVPAKAIVSGVAGNIQPLTINAVYGTSLYIRNLKGFTGGKDAYSVKVVTPQDRQNAIDAVRASLTAQKAEITAFLAFPCIESSQIGKRVVGLSWACQYVSYSVPSYVKVTHVRLVGKKLLVDVVFVARPLMTRFR